MVDPTLEHQTIGLSGRALSFALFAKYVGLTLYGISAMLVEIPTFVIVGSSFFASAWATIVMSLALSAALGVARTWTTGRYRLEKWTTAAFVLVFSGYTFALIFRSATTNDYDSLPLALIPLVVCILPTVRFYSFLPKRRREVGS